MPVLPKPELETDWSTELPNPVFRSPESKPPVLMLPEFANPVLILPAFAEAHV